MNRAFLIGNLTKEPELRQTPNGVSVCSLSIAVKRDFGEETDFFNVTVWRAQAENCEKYLKKGNKVAIVGSVQNRSFEDKDGIKRTVTEIIASDVEFLTPKEKEQSVVSYRNQLEAIDDNTLPF